MERGSSQTDAGMTCAAPGPGSPPEAAVAAARATLLANVFEEDGRPRLSAGGRQYRSVWARDFCFATGGLLAAGRGDVVRSTLEAFASFQRPDGLLPRLLDARNPFLRIAAAGIGLRLPVSGSLKPNYLSEHGEVSVDGGALAAWAASRYVAATADAEFCRRLWPVLERAMGYYDGVLLDGLVNQPPFSDWQDSVAYRRGLVFFTSLVYWRGLKAMASLAAAAGPQAAPEGPDPWTRRAEELWRRAHARFWDEGVGAYANVAGTPFQLSADGNLFAVAWGFCRPGAAKRVLDAFDALDAWTPWGPRCTVPSYPPWGKSAPAVAAGIPGYHDRYVWLWQSALALRALRAAGRGEAAEALSGRLAELVLRDGEAGEIYDPASGLPVRRWLYRSESPFSWSAGMLLEAWRPGDAPPL